MAVLSADKTRNNAQAQAFRDNLVLPYEGIRASALTPPQRQLLLDAIGKYVQAKWSRAQVRRRTETGEAPR